MEDQAEVGLGGHQDASARSDPTPGMYAAPPSYDFTSTPTAISTVEAGQLKSEGSRGNFWRSARWSVD